MENCSCCGFLTCHGWHRASGASELCPGTCSEVKMPRPHIWGHLRCWPRRCHHPVGQGQPVLGFLRALCTARLRERSRNVGTACGVAVPQQEGLNPHFSAGQIVLLGSITVAALPGVPTPITARALWLSPSFLLEKGVIFFLPHPRRVLRALLSWAPVSRALLVPRSSRDLHLCPLMGSPSQGLWLFNPFLTFRENWSSVLCPKNETLNYFAGKYLVKYFNN